MDSPIPVERFHDLKTWPDPFQAMWEGRKPFDVRKDDRGGFMIGDILRLREWDPVIERYTGRRLRRTVTYILSGPTAQMLGVQPGYVVLGLPCPLNDPASAALRLAADHLRHMSAWVAARNAGYSFESLGEDWWQIEAGLQGVRP